MSGKVPESSRPDRTQRRPSPLEGWAGRYVLPLVLMLVFACLTVVVWLTERQREWRVFYERSSIIQEQLARRLEQMIQLELRPLRRLQRDWLLGRLDDANFQEQAQSMVEALGSYKLLATVDENNICIEAAPTDSGLRGTALDEDPAWEPLLARAKTTGSFTAGQSVPRDDGTHLMAVVAPVAPEGQSYQGALIALVHVEALLSEQVDPETRRDVVVLLRDQQQTIFRTEGEPSDSAPLIAPAKVQVLDRQWILQVRPTDRSVSVSMRDTTGVLWAGLSLSFVATAAVFQALQNRWEQNQRTRRQLASLESLNEISTVIGAQLGSGQRLLDKLAEGARQLLNMGMAAVCMLDDSRQNMEIIAVSGAAPGEVRRAFPLAALPAARKCLESSQILSIPDVQQVAGQVNSAVVALYNIRSITLIPLVIEQRTIGVLALGDPSPRQLSELDLRLAGLLGSQVAVTIANSRLYEQTRLALEGQKRLLGQATRDAETKAMLLRELNHRVKNNLAGIVGLLSVGQPPMSPDAQQWLDHSVERIRTIARAHDLFSQGAQRVSLGALVQQVVPSLSAVHTQSVQVQVELDGRELWLQTDRAVSLAMVLHELCYNAIRHGLGGAGVVKIRSQQVEGGRVRIQVINQARERETAGVGGNGTSTGVGLELVRGLVGRELRGQFSFQDNVEGCTLATVEFPLDE